MRRFLLCAFVLATGAAGTARADLVTATLVDAVGNTHQVIARPGASFSVSVELSTDVSLVSGQLKVREVTSPSAQGYLTLTGVTFADPPWDSAEALSFTSPDPLDAPGYISQEVGTFADDVVAGTGTGTFNFVTFDFSVSPTAMSGTYKLNLVDMIFGDANYNEAPAVAGADYEVVVPAPGALALGVVGLGLVGWMRRRWSVKGGATSGS